MASEKFRVIVREFGISDTPLICRSFLIAIVILSSGTTFQTYTQEEETKTNLDRFEENYATTCCDDSRKFNVPMRLRLQIPKHINERSRINTHLKEGTVIGILNDEEGTKRIERQVKDKIEMLKHYQ